ncbi:DUF1315 domain-containing protein, partial [Cronobacter sakazakii]
GQDTHPQQIKIGTDGQLVMKSKQQLKAEFGINQQPIATLKPE